MAESKSTETPSRWVAVTIFLLAPTPVAIVPRRRLGKSVQPNSTALIPRPGRTMPWHVSPIIRFIGSTACCLGTSPLSSAAIPLNRTEAHPSRMCPQLYVVDTIASPITLKGIPSTRCGPDASSITTNYPPLCPRGPPRQSIDCGTDADTPAPLGNNDA